MCLKLAPPVGRWTAPRAIMITTSGFFSDAIFFFALLNLFYANQASGLLDHDCASMDNLSVTHWRGEALTPALRFFFLSPRK